MIDMSYTLPNQSVFSRATSIRCSSAVQSGFNVKDHTQTEYELEFFDIDNDDELDLDRDDIDSFITQLPDLNRQESR